jgi:N-acetylglutamate synthase-like GNAT family acetyltransferase
MDYTVTKNEFTISTDKSKINIDYVHEFLSNSYWSPGVPLETVKKAMENSLCFGVYNNNNKQFGYARMITDYATFAYMADVFIDEKFRGKGLGKWLVEVMMTHPALQGLRRVMLATKDAHKLYEQCGFTSISNPERYMVYNPTGFKTK